MGDIQKYIAAQKAHSMQGGRLSVILPDRTLKTILRELIDSREVFMFLVLRHVLVKYKQAVLGASWVVLRPLLMVSIFSFVFSRMSTGSFSVPYFLIALCGLIPWQFFADSLTYGGNALINEASLITKIYFPRILLPISVVVATLLDLGISVLLLLGAWAIWGSPLSLQSLFMLVVACVEVALFSLGSVLFIAPLMLKFRDIKHILPFIVQISMYISPVVYTLSMLPEKVRIFFYLNPLVGSMELLRAAFAGESCLWVGVGISYTVSLLICFIGITIFRFFEREFADLV